MTEQPTAEDRVATLRTIFDGKHRALWNRAHAEELFNIITDLRASLRREENSQQILARENERLRIALNVACGENEG